MVKRFLSLLMCPLLLGLCGCGGAVGLETVTSTTEPATVNRLEEPVFDYIAYSRIDKGGTCCVIK